jgi:hypothetical protein
MIITGSIVIMVAVRIKSHLFKNDPTKLATANGSVCTAPPELSISRGRRKSFQIHILLRMITVTVMGVRIGNTILKKVAGFEQPSMTAASSSSSGTDLIKP